MKSKLSYIFAGSLFLLFFIFLGYLVRFQPNYLVSLDEELTKFVRFLYPFATIFFIWITKLADPLTVAILTIVSSLMLFKKHYWIESYWLLINTALVAGLLNPLLKLLIMRQRPTLVHLVTEHSYSFPSGHSTGSILLYGTFIFLLPLFIKKNSLRLLLQCLLGILIILIGFSRIYLGVHFPSDIIGGFCFGLAWLFLSYPIYYKKRYFLNS